MTDKTVPDDVVAELLAFALGCAANNPAAIGSTAKASELLDRLGIEHREGGLFFHDHRADLADARKRLANLAPDPVNALVELESSLRSVWWAARSPESLADALVTDLAKRNLALTKDTPHG